AQNDSTKAQDALEKAFSLLPGAMQLRYQHAVLLMNSQKATQAVPYLDRVLHEAPWIIEDGNLLANAYREAGKLNELTDLALALEPAEQLSVERKSYTLGWLSNLAGSVSEQQPDMALKLWRRCRELADTADTALGETQTILGHLSKQRDAAEFLKEFERLLPEE